MTGCQIFDCGHCFTLFSGLGAGAPVPACFSGLGGRAVLLAFVRFRYTPKRLNLFAFVHFCSTPAPTRAGVFRRVRRPPRRSLLVAFGLPPRRPQKGYFGVFRCISGHSRPLPSSQFAGSRWRAVPRPHHWCPARSVLVGFGLPHHRPAGVFRRVHRGLGPGAPCGILRHITVP